MAIEKNSFKVLSRFDLEFLLHRRETVMSSDDEDFQRRSSAAMGSDDDDDDLDDCDSGAGSDDFDLLELGEAGEEFCQVEDQTCRIPYELYDLPGLLDILSLDVWNEVLTAEDRFSLTHYLPDMEQETFLRTLKELFTGCNLHFGNPIDKLFIMLKGGLCEPRVALYRQGLNFFQKRQHYHRIRNHQNSMVTNLCQIRDAWSTCKGYSIEEKLQVLNIMKSQKSLMCEKMEEMESESSERDSGDVLWGKRIKDWKLEQKMGHYSSYGINSGLDVSSRGKQRALEPATKHIAKGSSRTAGTKASRAKELTGRALPAHNGFEMKSGPLVKHNKTAGYNHGALLQMREQLPVDDEDNEAYEVSLLRDQSFSRVGPANKSGNFKAGKKHEGLVVDHYSDNYLGSPMPWKNDLHPYGRNKSVNQLSDIKVLTAKPFSAYGKKLNDTEHFQQLDAKDQTKYGKGHNSNLSMTGNQMVPAQGSEPFYLGRAPGEPFFAGPSNRYGEWNIKSKKWKMGRESPDVSDRLFPSEYRAHSLHEKSRASSALDAGRDMEGFKRIRTFSRNDETDSDSSEQNEENNDEDDNPLMRSKLAYPTGVDPRKGKFLKKNKNENLRALDRSSNSFRKIDDFGMHLGTRKVGNMGMRVEPKARMHDVSFLNSSSVRNFGENYLSGSGRLSGDDDWQQISKAGRNSPMQGGYDVLPIKDRRRKGEFSREYGDPQSNFIHDYGLEGEDRLCSQTFARDNGVVGKTGKKDQTFESHADSRVEKSDPHLMSCKSSKKKRKVKNDLTYDHDDKEYNHSDVQLQLDEPDISRKKGKKKLEDGNETLEKEVSDLLVTDTAVEELELDVKPQKKPFILITPTVHTGFSFSIIHLLSAVRMAMITLLPEDSVDAGDHLDKNKGKPVDQEDKDTITEGLNGLHTQGDTDQSVASAQVRVPSLTIQEIVNRVRTNPGDPCILETQEPLQDLVRGVLKIYSSKTAPLGAKGWKPVVVYEKSAKSWSWIGPVNHNSPDHEAIEEVTTPEAWSLPQKMLVKLVDAFANWLKNGQETLQQIGSLPPPPSSLMEYNFDEKERFKDLRAQKSLSTISPSSEEVRAYFRKEEGLRYSIPDRAFSYTAIDGKKSIVAPLRRCGGKPTSKARDHFMLKRDRPPHVTILCLVRDAAARLPGNIGTRADVCTLIRDSQYIVEDVSDAQVNQVVSGALDRLHYERDPCVQFDGERKLWVYLHREREEEDFEDDGTSSTKKWKRQRKEATGPDQGSVTVAYPGSSEQTGFDLTSDLNVEPHCMDEDKGADLMSYGDDKQNLDSELHCMDEDKGAVVMSYNEGKGHLNVEAQGIDEVKGADLVSYDDCNVDNVFNSHGSVQGAVDHGPTRMTWNDLALSPMQENRLLCQENSTNEDFDDEPLGREPPN